MLEEQNNLESAAFKTDTCIKWGINTEVKYIRKKEQIKTLFSFHADKKHFIISTWTVNKN